MAMTGPREGGVMSEINVTPFVDVMLVLLIIFMVTAPMMTTGVDIDLPHAEAPTLSMSDDQTLLSIDKDGLYGIKDQSGPERKLELAQLAAVLKEIARNKPDQPVFVQADGALPYEKVLQLLALARTAGIVKVGLVTQPPVSQP